MLDRLATRDGSRNLRRDHDEDHLTAALRALLPCWLRNGEAVRFVLTLDRFLKTGLGPSKAIRSAAA